MLVNLPNTIIDVRSHLVEGTKPIVGRGILMMQQRRKNTTFSTVRISYDLLCPCFQANVVLDDLPVIRENIRKGFLDTQSKVSSWVQSLKKKIDGEEDDGNTPSTRVYGEESYGRPRRSGELGRRSGDRERYDADPQVLSDDFSVLELKDSEGRDSLVPLKYSSG
jgi:hypothetical protein